MERKHFCSDLPESNKENSELISFVNGKTEDTENKTAVVEDTPKEANDSITSNVEPTSKYISILSEDIVLRVRKDINSKSRELFSECQEEVKKFLSEAPYKEFRMSMYFHRYLQWKYLERQQVTYKTFRMYRVLGKLHLLTLKRIIYFPSHWVLIGLI